MRHLRNFVPEWVTPFAVWGMLALAVLLPVVVAGLSPLQTYRSLPYVAASVAGVLSLGLLLVQPSLAAGYLPGLGPSWQRRLHARIGAALVVAVAVHIGGLYLASPPDALDALLLRSPTPFSVWGVTAMWGVVLTVLLMALRGRLRPKVWRLIHNGLALVVVIATVIHALQIDGTMGAASKWALCMAAIAASAVAVVHLRLVMPLRRRRQRAARIA